MAGVVVLDSDNIKKLKSRIERLVTSVLKVVPDDTARVEIAGKLIEIRRLLDGERADN